jgi:ATP-dependent DNA ligase
MAFDVLSVDGRNVMSLTYDERRTILEDLGLNDRFWKTPTAFDDGAARRPGRYVPGERAWELKRECALQRRPERQFV